MHRRHDRTHLRHAACVGVRIGFTRNHVGEQLAFHPPRQADPTSFAGLGDFSLSETLARLRQKRFGCRYTGLDQGAGPDVLRLKRNDVMVPRAVQPEDERQSISRIGHAKRDIFGQTDEA